MPDSDIQRLVERIEGAMIDYANLALTRKDAGRRAANRQAAAEFAMIAIALRARITERTDDE